MSSNPRTARHPRRWGVGIGLAGATVAAAMIGLASAPSARADNPQDVLDQASQDLAHASLVLEQAPTATLDAQQIAALTPEENLIATSQSFNSVLGADQAELPAADQAGLADVDQSLLQADQGLLEAAQGFLAADQAGDLTSFASALPTDLATLDADFGLLGALLNAGGAELGAEFFNAIGVPDIFLP
jgi:hypothetical protein